MTLRRTTRSIRGRKRKVVLLNKKRVRVVGYRNTTDANTRKVNRVRRRKGVVNTVDRNKSGRSIKSHRRSTGMFNLGL